MEELNFDHVELDWVEQEYLCHLERQAELMEEALFEADYNTVIAEVACG